jgi:hypothetical protein
MWHVDANIQVNSLTVGAGSPNKLHGVTLQKVIFMFTNEIN